VNLEVDEAVETRKRTPGSIVPLYGALGAEDPWAILSHLLDQGLVSKDQIAQAASGPMDKDAEERVLAQVRARRQASAPEE
jgi:hypothetical protein